MNEFVTAALPLVLLGLALAIIAAGFARKESPESAERRRGHMGLGAGIGLMLGVVLGLFGLWQSLGMSFGLCTLWGMALGSLVRVR